MRTHRLTGRPPVSVPMQPLKDDHWEVSETGNVVTRYHVNGRNAMFDPSCTKCPFPARESYNKSLSWTVGGFAPQKAGCVRNQLRMILQPGRFC